MNAVPMPGYSVVAGALRVTTERLTREIATPQDSAPSWNDFEWTVARAVSAMHGISGLLAARLRWCGPPGWGAFLLEQKQQTVAREECIDQLLTRLHRALGEAGVPCVALKGSAVRKFRLHHPGDRPMGDVDLLVRPEDTARASAAIVTLGYRHAYSARRHVVFAPLASPPLRSYGEHVDSPLRIELHSRVTEELPADAIDITDSLWPADSVPGVNPYASFAALTRHVMFHTTGNMRAHAMRFLQIYEIALLARRLGAADWQELRGENPGRSAWWMYPSMIMAERYLPGSIPSDQLELFAANCPRRLRARFQKFRVYDVSWSNLRIHALPGIEWARTWGEALRFARSRAAPKRDYLNELADGIRTLPHLTRTRWYQTSQAERILRWVFSRPPRVQTLHSVQSALDSMTPAADRPITGRA